MSSLIIHIYLVHFVVSILHSKGIYYEQVIDGPVDQMELQLLNFSENDAGGVLTENPVEIKFYVNGYEVAVDGAIGTTHDPMPYPQHSHLEGEWRAQAGSPKFFINGVPVVLSGDMDSCEHVRQPSGVKFKVG